MKKVAVKGVKEDILEGQDGEDFKADIGVGRYWSRPNRVVRQNTFPRMILK